MCSLVSMCVTYCKEGDLITITTTFSFACAHISKNKLLIVRRYVTGMSILRHGAEIDFDILHF